VNGFGNPKTGISPRSSLFARHLLSAALQHHASLSTKVTNNGDDLDLQPTNKILGHLLPPADMFLNYHCSAAFPMATLLTTEQVNNAPQPQILPPP
jgi:hypothetical protein